MSRRALVVTLLASSTAWAQAATTGVAAERFVPAVGPASLVGVEGAASTAPGALSWATSLDFVHDPITLRGAYGGALVTRPVADALVADAALEFGLWKRLAVAVGVPAVLWQRGDRLQGTGIAANGGTTTVDETALATTSAGDVRVRLKGTLADGRTLGAALIVQVTAPTGGAHDFAATDGATVEPRLVVDAHAGRLTLAATVGVRFAKERTLFSTSLGDELTWSAGLAAALLDGARAALAVIVESAGGVGAAAGTRPAELRGALRLRLGPVTLDGGAGGGLDADVGAPAWRAFLVARGGFGLTR